MHQTSGFMVLLALAAHLPGQAPAPEPPVTGRPADFGGAIGSFEITSRAVPTELQAEEPITFTIRITGTGNLDQLARPDLRRLPAFTKSFAIEEGEDRYLPLEHVREFDYLLRPRFAGVKEIPRLPFVYFRPGLVPEHLGYQTTYAPAVPVIVRPRSGVRPSDLRGGGAVPRVPELFYRLAEVRLDGPELPRSFLSAPVLGLLFLAPPATCATWYLVWKRRNPSAARLARLRRSRAAQRALKQLDMTKGPEELGRVLGIVTDYLGQRFDLQAAEPTPAEVEAQVRSAGVPGDLVAELAQLYRDADVVRFAPTSKRKASGWAEQAKPLIVALEAAACQVRSCSSV